MPMFSKPFQIEANLVEGQEGVARARSGAPANLPHFKGMLICRRCDLCGTRISLKSEADEKIVLMCPACQREYIFRNNID